MCFQLKKIMQTSTSLRAKVPQTPTEIKQSGRDERRVKVLYGDFMTYLTEGQTMSVDDKDGSQ
jgi:hypothetical protein